MVLDPTDVCFYQVLYFKTNKTKLMTHILSYIPALFIFSFIYNIYEYQQQNILYRNTYNRLYQHNTEWDKQKHSYLNPMYTSEIAILTLFSLCVTFTVA